MTIKKRGQISTEYLITMGFITFVIIGILASAFGYISIIRDQIRSNQIEDFSKKIISASEKIFYAGEPSKTTLNAYLPSSITSVEILDKNIIIKYETEAGEAIRAFTSNVNLSGTISKTEGLKRIVITAQQNKVLIEE